MTIVLTGGGTGGHIYPALSIAAALDRRGARTLFIGNGNGLEARLVPQHHVAFAPIAAKGFGHRGPKEFAAGTIAVVRGMADATRHLRSHRVGAIVGTGGYASASVVLAGVLLRIPVILHEPNVVAGQANVWLSRFAQRVAVGFEATMDRLPRHKCVVTGVAVRVPAAIPNKEQARKALDLDPERPVLLVVGGSQGAVALNETTAAALDRFGAMGLQVVHQTGPKHYEDVARVSSVTRPWYRAFPYIEDMTSAYAAADVAVTRSGASTVAEVALYGLPTVFIPFPFAADDHQRANAALYESAGAGRLLPQADLTAEALIANVTELMEPSRRATMQARLAGLARPKAADDIARLTMELARRSRNEAAEHPEGETVGSGGHPAR